MAPLPKSPPRSRRPAADSAPPPCVSREPTNADVALHEVAHLRILAAASGSSDPLCDGRSGRSIRRGVGGWRSPRRRRARTDTRRRIASRRRRSPDESGARAGRSSRWSCRRGSARSQLGACGGEAVAREQLDGAPPRAAPAGPRAASLRPRVVITIRRPLRRTRRSRVTRPCSSSDPGRGAIEQPASKGRASRSRARPLRTADQQRARARRDRGIAVRSALPRAPTGIHLQSSTPVRRCTATGSPLVMAHARPNRIGRKLGSSAVTSGPAMRYPKRDDLRRGAQAR
jgi:hypothetical protein